MSLDAGEGREAKTHRYLMEKIEKARLPADGQPPRLLIVISPDAIAFSSSGNLANSSILSMDTLPFSTVA
jgi:hypothetical protein